MTSRRVERYGVQAVFRSTLPLLFCYVPLDGVERDIPSRNTYYSLLFRCVRAQVVGDTSEDKLTPHALLHTGADP